MQTITLQRVKDILWAIVFAGLVASILRFAVGLGAATGLNDASPWGLWIAFKLGFVAMAGGGFTLAALVYIFHLESYRPILRRAILLALLGYGSFIVSLLFDLGLPLHIYMPIVNWQHHSVMFEIAWCVMLYFSVLVMEFGPVILEHRWFDRPLFRRVHRLLHKATVPLVVAGIVLSTLHQSSLGSLFLIMPHRVHPLWYSAWIPVLFFTSAIAAGLFALIVESFLAERLFGRRVDSELLARLGKGGAFVMLLYLSIRLGDLLVRGVLSTQLDGSWQSLLFGVEVLVGGILPAVLLLSPRVRCSRAAILTCSTLGVAGVLSQRMSLSMFTLWRPDGSSYLPSTFEIIIAFAIPAAAGLIYLLFAEHLPIFADKAAPVLAGSTTEPQFALGNFAFNHNGQPWLARRSGMAVLMFAFVVAALPAQGYSGSAVPASPVKPALGWETLIIDGDLDGLAVSFPHLAHQHRLEEHGGSSACLACHHLEKPQDQGTGCSECHQDNFAAESIFDHRQHVAELGGNIACRECHSGEHRAATAVPCGDCHEQMLPASGESMFSFIAPGYQEAMHGKCLACHREQADRVEKPDLAGCATCHYEEQDSSLVGDHSAQSEAFNLDTRRQR